jgi:hypothetical protein
MKRIPLHVDVVKPAPGTALSPETLRLAHCALVHMERSIRPWAELEDEHEARAHLARLQDACAELAAAVRAATLASVRAA